MKEYARISSTLLSIVSSAINWNTLTGFFWPIYWVSDAHKIQAPLTRCTRSMACASMADCHQGSHLRSAAFTFG